MDDSVQKVGGDVSADVVALGPPVLEIDGMTDHTAATSTAVVPITPVTKLGRFLQAVKDTKELISIALFFGAGVLWVGGYFATKAQLVEVRCLMQSQLDLLQSQTDLNVVKNEMVDVGTQIDELSSRQKNGPLSDVDKRRYHELNDHLDDLKLKRATAQKTTDDVQAKLKQAACTPH